MTKYVPIKNLPVNVSSSLEDLNNYFKPLSFQERLCAFYLIFDKKDVLVTSSFGSSSAFLLYWISQFQKQQKIHFTNTGFHFGETLEYKAELSQLYGLQVEDIFPEESAHQGTKQDKLWQTHPDACCAINKIDPFAPIKARHKVWVSGVMGFQTPHRAQLNIFERQGDIIKFHPVVDLSEGDFLYYQSYLKLPEHPLKIYGYESIGCMHCTVQGSGREGRWQGAQKTECGLHTDTPKTSNEV
ncbi:MAG: phosphoadenylyl-sulfate reductase [Bacteroidota bacterium]